MATTREILQAIEDDYETRHCNEMRDSYARIYMFEATEVAFRIEGELMLGSSQSMVTELVKQFDQLTDAWVDLMIGL